MTALSELPGDRELALRLLVAHDGVVTTAMVQDEASRRGRRAWDLFEHLEEEGLVEYWEDRWTRPRRGEEGKER